MQIQIKILCMKKLILIIFVLSISCTSNKTRLPASDAQITDLQSIISIEKKYEADIANFQELVEEALVWREKTTEFLKENKANLKQKNQLSHQDLLSIMENGKQYLHSREKILKIIAKFRFHEGSEFEFSPGAGSDIKESGGYDYITGKNDFHYKVKIDPTDEAGKEMLLKLKLSFAAATILYDNYMIGIYPFETHRKSRKILNWDTPEYTKALEDITDNFFNLKNRIEFLATLSIYEESEEYFESNQNIKKTKVDEYFSELINQSSIYQFMNSDKINGKRPSIIRAFANRVYDKVRFLVDSFSYFASKTFGNTAGLFATRKGKLKSLSKEERKEITDQLQPLDILLEKTPFRLTDKFIPGHYGHVAIWAGSKEQLQNLGVWDNPIVAKYHSKIEKGRLIIEALRPGVEMNSFDHFLNIDDLLVLRDRTLTDEQRKEFIIRAFEQVGKDYDFNFDVETDSKIVCSEIVYVVFHNIQWPTDKVTGRFTISPDHVVAKAINNGPLEPIIMYLSGKKQNENFEEILKKLIK